MIEKSGARPPELEEPASLKVLVLDEALSPPLLQAINAAVSTRAKGMRNRRLPPLPTGICLVGWLSIELPLKVSSAMKHRFGRVGATYKHFDAAHDDTVSGINQTMGSGGSRKPRSVSKSYRRFLITITLDRAVRFAVGAAGRGNRRR